MRAHKTKRDTRPTSELEEGSEASFSWETGPRAVFFATLRRHILGPPPDPPAPQLETDEQVVALEVCMHVWSWFDRTHRRSASDHAAQKRLMRTFRIEHRRKDHDERYAAGCAAVEARGAAFLAATTKAARHRELRGLLLDLRREVDEKVWTRWNGDWEALDRVLSRFNQSRRDTWASRVPRACSRYWFARLARWLTPKLGPWSRCGGRSRWVADATGDVRRRTGQLRNGSRAVIVRGRVPMMGSCRRRTD